MNVSEIKVISNDGQVIVTNASGKMITLSNILGQTIGVRRANSEYFSMPATSGIVLVTVEGDATYKVIVKERRPPAKGAAFLFSNFWRCFYFSPESFFSR